MAIKYKPKDDKIVEAILFMIVSSVQEKTRHLTQYDIVKTMFLADRAHLNRYGRPISFDRYFALEYGPVPERTYDMLKPGFDFERQVGQPVPWFAVREGNISRFVKAKREPNYRKLSGSDRKALHEALGTVLSLSFDQLKRLTHEDPAYKEVWQEGGTRFEMHLESFFDEKSEDKLEEAEYVSQFA